MPDIKRPQTIAAAHGVADDPHFGAVAPPIYLASTYKFDCFDGPKAHEYSRTSNPTRDQLANALALLESGAGAVVTASGMAAIDLVLSQVAPGDAVLAPHDCYSGTRRLLELRAGKGHFDVAFVDQTDSRALDAALSTKPKLVFAETPSNPLLRIVDIAALAERAKASGALVAVDNTFLSPALQTPIPLGADFVVHSTTKFINGHSDVVGGAVVAATQRQCDELAAWANATGVTGSAFDSYQTLRGLRTLFPRIERQQQTAAAIARFLERQPQVSKTYYPGLPAHPGHDVAERQQRGFGALVSFEIKGDVGTVAGFLEGLTLFTLAESLGGVESLVAHPATMTHASMSETAREAAGINNALIRLSVGLEAESDLIEDLAQALYHADA